MWNALMFYIVQFKKKKKGGNDLFQLRNVIFTDVAVRWIV